MESKYLWRRLMVALFAVAAALLSMAAATFAWYIYNAAARTTRVELAAGSSVSLQIANAYDGLYGSSTVMEEFTGRLVPVSTDRIAGGFQRVTGFQGEWNPQSGQYRSVASHFAPSIPEVNYYKTSLYLRTNSDNLGIYLSDIGYQDDSSQDPVSTAIRVGILVQGQEYIFEINQAHNPNADDNGAREPEGGHVLRSDRTDGSTVAFTPLNRGNFCNYDRQSGAVSLKPESRALFTLSGNGNGGYGTPVQVDIYLWLEGCDEDCTLNLQSHTMENIALSFAGFAGKGV